VSKNYIDFSKLFSWENIFVKSPYYGKRKKKEEKGNTSPLFPQPPNPTQEITPWKKKSSPLPIPLNKTP
jgi:hypothetical protein